MFEELYSEPRPGISGGSLKARDLGTVTTPITKIKRLDPGTSWSFFHPNRVDARLAPPDFRAQVHAIDPNLEVVWHPLHERWCVWVKNPRVRHHLCPGWQLLFPVRYGDGSYMPLDARTLALIFDRSARKWGNGRQYWDRIQDEIRHDYNARRREHSAVVGQNARDRWDFAQIKVSGCGHSSGSKFSTHHSGN
jgi:hypothetical protein